MKGDVVKIIPAELRKPSGEIDDPLCGGKSFWTYTLAGKEDETWTPKFFYRGARYLQVELRPAETNGPAPRVISMVADVVHAAAPATGTFQTSNELFNRIFTLVRWAQRGNMMSVLTDCPHREKLGWLEQDYLNGPALRYNFDLNPLFGKIVNDINDAQQPDGLVRALRRNTRCSVGMAICSFVSRRSGAVRSSRLHGNNSCSPAILIWRAVTTTA